MSKTHVEITYSRKKGLVDILVNGEELDITYIPGKSMDDWTDGTDWFTPSKSRDGWEGLIREIQAFLSDWSEDISFSFYGPPEYQQTFFRHLGEHGIFIDNGLSKEDQAESLFEDGKRAAHHQNYNEAWKCYQAAAKLGYAEAQFCAAELLMQGKYIGAEFDKSQVLYQAAMLYKQAAEQSHSMAMCRLAECYSDGKGIPENKIKAAEWYQKAAEQGLAAAQYRFGVCCKNGVGAQQDHKKAAEWFRKAAVQGDADALYSLGICYKDGLGVIQSDEQAVEWYRKAAEQGHVNAQYRLARCYETGQGVPVDESQAAEWYRRVAEQERSNIQQGDRSV